MLGHHSRPLRPVDEVESSDSSPDWGALDGGKLLRQQTCLPRRLLLAENDDTCQPTTISRVVTRRLRSASWLIITDPPGIRSRRPSIRGKTTQQHRVERLELLATLANPEPRASDRSIRNERDRGAIR